MDRISVHAKTGRGGRQGMRDIIYTRARPAGTSWQSAIRDRPKSDSFYFDCLANDAGTWLHCAVGERLGFGDQDRNIAVIINDYLESRYQDIFVLGMKFQGVVKAGAWDRAQAVYDEIAELVTPAVVEDVQKRGKLTAECNHVPLVTMDLGPALMDIITTGQAAGTGGAAA